MSNDSPAIGIDLGTTHCCVGYLNPNNNTVEIIENREGYRTTPSYVAFTDRMDIVGKLAKENLSRMKENVVYDAKRLIGQKFDNAKFLKRNTSFSWQFKVVPDFDNTPLIEIYRHGKAVKYKPQEISALLLKYLKSIAEERLDAQIKDAVITVPAHFTQHQRSATEEAGKLAGLNILKIINEPTAAALAYIHKNSIRGTILVFDLGGGTFDISIVTVKDNSVTVRATAGNPELGGRDFDTNLSNFIADKIEKDYKRSIKNNRVVLRRISDKCEKIKINLSIEDSTYLHLDCLFDGKDVNIEITRDDFNKINMALFETCINSIKNCLQDACLTKADIDKIVLIGGSTRIPKMQEMLREYFEGKELTKAINPDEAVAYGAALQAALFSNKSVLVPQMSDITLLSLGIRVGGGLMSTIIPRNSLIPISKTKKFRTKTDKQTRVTVDIFEGERLLTEGNTKIGTIKVRIPHSPPGYPISISFNVNSNGILEVSAKSGNGDYVSLMIEHEIPNTATTNDLVKDAKANITKDYKIYHLIKEKRKLENYCRKILAICNYDKRGMAKEERNYIQYICRDTLSWLDDNKIEDGNQEEVNAFRYKMEEVERICESITNSYGYYIKDASMAKFHRIITE